MYRYIFVSLLGFISYNIVLYFLSKPDAIVSILHFIKTMLCFGLNLTVVFHAEQRCLACLQLVLCLCWRGGYFSICNVQIKILDCNLTTYSLKKKKKNTNSLTGTRDSCILLSMLYK